VKWLEVLSDFDFEIVHVPGEVNKLANALSRMYSDEPKGIVQAESEYMTAEPENAPSTLILNMVSAPVYTGESIFLGAMSRKRKAQKPFPNAKKVVLKLGNPSQPLEGERHTKKSEILNIDSNPLEDGSNGPNDTSELLLDIPDSPVHHPASAPLESEDSTPSEHQVNPDDRHGPHDATMSNNDSLSTEILSEDPISLTEVLESGDPTLDIHN
jgi:hypothetical protein